MDRRAFLKGAGTLTGAVLPLTALLARAQNPAGQGGVVGGRPAGYGPLVPSPDRTTGLPLISLPEGFSYLTLGWTGDLLNDGTPTPAAHDGMATFAAGGSMVRLVRNHERGVAPSFGPGVATYDKLAGGGTTTLVFDTQKGELLSAAPTMGGTMRNCAGGLTPWGSWLTCEETFEHTGPAGLPHGYIFEVPADGLGDPTPLRDMGRYSHEAVAVDPATGYVYETEDAGPASGFYRFVPNVAGKLAQGGRLYMLKVAGVHQADLTGVIANGTTFDVEWKQIGTPDTPDPPGPQLRGNFVWAQGRAQGAATFARLEGAWYGNAKIYIVSTSGGGSSRGQIWEYSPAQERLRMLFQSPGPEVLEGPDNICVSPRGGLVVCEDGAGPDFLQGLTVDGEIFQFAKHTVVLKGERNGITGDFTGSEWAGACYSPDGKWLFANIQSPGITIAITGPWGSGAL